LNRFWRRVDKEKNGIGGRIVHDIASIPKDYYDEKATILRSKCNPQYIEYLKSNFPHIDAPSRAKVCRVDCPTHYHVTDIAIHLLMRKHKDLRYLLVTNADNYYSPEFFDDAITMMNFDEKNGGTDFDVVLTDMVHGKNKRKRSVRPIKGHLDLGCALLRIDFLLYHNMTSFIDTLHQSKGSELSPLDYFEADGLFIEEARRLGARVGFVRKLNFVHG